MAGRQKGNFRRRRSDVMRWTPPAPIVGLPVFSLEAPRRPTSRSRTRVANGSKTERQSSAAMLRSELDAPGPILAFRRFRWKPTGTLRSELDARGADFGLPTFSLETHRHPTLQGRHVFPPPRFACSWEPRAARIISASAGRRAFRVRPGDSQLSVGTLRTGKYTSRRETLRMRQPQL